METTMIGGEEPILSTASSGTATSSSSSISITGGVTSNLTATMNTINAASLSNNNALNALNVLNASASGTQNQAANNGVDPVLDIDFQYADTDSHANEIAELYSYTEENDFLVNRAAFEELMEDWGLPLAWPHHTGEQRSKALSRFAEGLEVSLRRIRIKCLRAVLYLVQGTFGDCLTLEEQELYARKNVFMLYRAGMFPLIVQLLHLEVDPILQLPMTSNNNSQNPNGQAMAAGTTAAGSTPAGPPPAAPKSKAGVSMIDSADLRAILSVIYTFVEVMHSENGTDQERLELREQFREELQMGTISGTDSDGILFAVVLFQMTTRFCNGSAPHFPIKKVLLVLWKVLLFTLGGSPQLRDLKERLRANVGLPPVPDDSLEVARTMRPASPPASANDLMESAAGGNAGRKMNRPFRRQSMIKQNAVATDEAVSAANNGNGSGNGNGNGNNGGEDHIDRDQSEDSILSSTPADKSSMDERSGSPPPRPSTPPPHLRGRTDQTDENFDMPHLATKGLPWKPKVRQREVDVFLDQARSRFIGFVLANDRVTTAGLPEPIKESIRILQTHSYASLADLQMKREDDLARYPLTMTELDPTTLDSPTERLYAEMLPHLPQYMIALLKILLAAAPTSKTKAESLNILSDLMPEPIEDTPLGMLFSMRLMTDASRHKEIIIKCVSAILLLLLKHFRLNHAYQFEYVAQQLMFANCIPLVLKFFNQNIFSYVTARNTISVIDFPACVIGEQPELTTEIIEMGLEQSPYCWRNLFAAVNLLRVLNKLTKWRNSRVMMLVVFKSAPILKRALRVKSAILQLYVLKLLKMQAKYLGRQWRKSNMKTLSAIYAKVRHRLTDDWAYGNDLDARPWDFQGEELQLQALLNRFHNRRYGWTANTGGGNAAAAGSGSISAGFNGPNSAPPSLHSAGAVGVIGIGAGDNQSGNSDFGPLGSLPGSGLYGSDSLDGGALSGAKGAAEVTPSFRYHYETWLEREVFNNRVDWDQLLRATDTTDM